MLCWGLTLNECKLQCSKIPHQHKSGLNKALNYFYFSNNMSDAVSELKMYNCQWNIQAQNSKVTINCQKCPGLQYDKIGKLIYSYQRNLQQKCVYEHTGLP